MAECNDGAHFYVNMPLWTGAALTVGTANDPLLPKLLQAINHANEIEISVSFVQPSGLELLLPALHDALANGARFKILTSDYLLITSPRALRQLLLLKDQGAEVRLFCCQPDAGFHMKAYIFTRNREGIEASGCAYIGSSNISKAALLTSHEWTLRYQYHGIDASAEFENIRQQFRMIFANPLSKSLDETILADYTRRYQEQAKTFRIVANHLEIEPEIEPNNAQIEALEALAETRQRGFKRGLVVLATGMGKTWLAAFDVKQLGAARVLFVAHREEILKQAQRTFSWLNPALSSGLFLADQKATEAEMIFASVQTLSKAQNLQCFSREHFDYIVVDEFHHAVGTSYQAILSYFTPKFLLGLTATPERTDQADILALCDYNLVYERNLVHGIDDKILVPFHYFGIFDPFVDYQEIPWRNGRFEPAALEHAFATRKRATHIFTYWQQHRQSRTLAFCVSRSHADYMAEYFLAQGVRAAAVYQGSQIRRNEALAQLEKLQLEVIFSVDLFNEGTDLPSIDTILMLRPTESKILFLQQLGRGLRRSTETAKQKLVIVDFIGNHRSFLLKPATLFNRTSTKELAHLAQKPPVLAPGCFVNFAPEAVAFWQQLAKELRNTALEDYQELAAELGHRPTASEFFNASYDLTKVRKQHGSWFELVASAEQDPAFTQLIDRYRDFLLRGIETTAMQKSFKMILLRAFVELDGLKHPVSLRTLAEHSWNIIWRRPDWARQDILPAVQHENATSQKWLKYWLNNPIQFYCKQDQKDTQAWFSRDEESMWLNFAIDSGDVNDLIKLIQELIDYRLAQYAASRLVISDDSPTYHVSAEPAANQDDFSEIPFYPDLKIACGHFGRGTPDDVELIQLPLSYGALDSSRFFVAPAKGNSMNGGKNPIKNGDLLLLEWVTPVSAGSISNNVMAIERLDEAGDATYLLRVVKKQPDGSYLLYANNPDYEVLPASSDMRTFARLKAIITSDELA